MAPCTHTMLLLPLLSGPSAEQSVLTAGAALWGSTTSGPGQGCMGTALRVLVESHWSTAGGAALPGRGASPIQQLCPRAGTQSHAGLSPQLCAVSRPLSQEQQGTLSPPEQQESTAKGFWGQREAGSQPPETKGALHVQPQPVHAQVSIQAAT